MRSGGRIRFELKARGEILGDAMVAAALFDRLVHHAAMVTLNGNRPVIWAAKLAAPAAVTR